MKIQKNAIKQMAYRDMALPSMSTGNYFNDIRVSIPSVPVISGPLLRGSLDTPLTVIQAQAYAQLIEAWVESVRSIKWTQNPQTHTQKWDSRRNRGIGVLIQFASRSYEFDEDRLDTQESSFRAEVPNAAFFLNAIAFVNNFLVGTLPAEDPEQIRTRLLDSTVDDIGLSNGQSQPEISRLPHTVRPSYVLFPVGFTNQLQELRMSLRERQPQANWNELLRRPDETVFI